MQIVRVTLMKKSWKNLPQEFLFCLVRCEKRSFDSRKLQNPWFSLRHGQYTLIFRFNFFSHGYTEYLFIHSEASGRANPVIIGPLFSCRSFFYPTVKPSTLYHAASTHHLVSSWRCPSLEHPMMINWCWHVWPLSKNWHRRPPVDSFHCDVSQAKPA